MWYPTRKYLTLTNYTNAYWVGSVDDRKITSGATFFLVNSLVLGWFNKKQSTIYQSTKKLEYIVETTRCTQVLWMKQTLKDIQVEYDHLISILCGNTSAINISRNLVMHSKTKHIPIKYHFLREKVT
jgi:hypothetical protein